MGIIPPKNHPQHFSLVVKMTSIPLSQLVPSELNVRKHPIDETRIVELANSIQSVGILQNLIVYPLKNGKYDVTAG
ncbi:Nucleoid occlusion protein [Xenorhabdus vietnamensis]|uniref:Nucleoid occlusion protein n=1 Tax=Xenorhabdus vietnamensis TaxID=351656 RepID=A0A1Y2S9Q7_9GAMM|nr:ParB N-terminal domain-containing protein [Xenorhabdus vietnamensis]OTA14425.1 Nucleoid occlusion protein [Xenorhabdus vietnamensis]